MQFGLCASLEHLETADAAGYDYLEPGVTGTLQPEQTETSVMPLLATRLAASRLNPEAFNLFLPGEVKVVGPSTDPERQERYLQAAFQRAKRLGGSVVVFGSGQARRIPDAWPFSEAQSQMREFLGRCGAAARRQQVTLVIEPLNTAECNFINSVAEAQALAEEVNHPAVAVLSDLYHVAQEKQSYDETRDAAPWLRHVHVAGIGRRAPAAEDHEFLAGYFSVLKQAGYSSRISIEAEWENVQQQAAGSLQVLRAAWDAA